MYKLFFFRQDLAHLDKKLLNGEIVKFVCFINTYFLEGILVVYQSGCRVSRQDWAGPCQLNATSRKPGI